MHELMTLLVENRDVPKTFVLDEASRYMDARVYSREVSTQYAPALKAMSKLGVEVVGAVGHTGKDVVPECKRLTNLAFWKSAQMSSSSTPTGMATLIGPTLRSSMPT